VKARRRTGQQCGHRHREGPWPRPRESTRSRILSDISTEVKRSSFFLSRASAWRGSTPSSPRRPFPGHAGTTPSSSAGSRSGTEAYRGVNLQLQPERGGSEDILPTKLRPDLLDKLPISRRALAYYNREFGVICDTSADRF
jgi:hypothetical protein